MFQALSFGNNCPRFEKEFADLKKLPEIRRFNEDHKDLYNYISLNTGMDLIDPIYNTSTVYDQLLVEVMNAIKVLNIICGVIYLLR